MARVATPSARGDGPGRLAIVALLLAACDARTAPSPPVPGTALTPPQPTATASASATAPASASATAPAPASGDVLVEEQEVTVGDAKERWRLVFASPPVPDCLDAGWQSCRCFDLAFGERGELALVRQRAGESDERLELGQRTVRRWPTLPDDPKRLAGAPDATEIRARKVVPAMVLGDYDHDGRATEFVLVQGGDTCGDHDVVLVGLSRAEPALHVFATVEAKTHPLSLMHVEDWESVKKRLPVEVPVQPCGWHGWPVHDVLRLRADAAGFHATHRRYACPSGSPRAIGKLMFERPWTGSVPSD